MNFLTIATDHITQLPATEGVPERCHQFDERSIKAVNAAIAAKRPLLVRGEPGVGKTQLAAAVAVELRRGYLAFTVDSRTESRDLLYRFDAVTRLADAQVLGHTHCSPEEIRKELAVERFLRPGPLWWAFDWKSIDDSQLDSDTPFALEHNETMRSSKHLEKNGWLVLIDEIDKAETDVPNGLLEALGMSQFRPLGRSKPVTVAGPAPLVVITTNEERVLPDAFIRRCMVLHLELPRTDDGLKSHLIKRGHAHFGKRVENDVLTRAADLLLSDRKAAIRKQLNPLPGQAEFLDLIRAVIDLAAQDSSMSQLEWIDDISRYALKKHPEMQHDAQLRQPG